MLKRFAGFFQLNEYLAQDEDELSTLKLVFHCFAKKSKVILKSGILSPLIFLHDGQHSLVDRLSLFILLSNFALLARESCRQANAVVQRKKEIPSFAQRGLPCRFPLYVSMTVCSNTC